MTKRQDLINNLIITSLSIRNDKASVFYDHAFVNEHGFYGGVIDTASINLFEPGLSESNKLIVAINYPYQGLNKDTVLDCLVKTFSIMASKAMGVIISLDKYDVENCEYENIREFLSELSELSSVEKRITIEYSWIKSEEHLSKILSIVSSYDDIILVFSGFLLNPRDTKVLRETAKICKISGFKTYEYFGALPPKLSLTETIFDMGYLRIGTPSSSISKILNDKL
jgi:hypothetical protein